MCIYRKFSLEIHSQQWSRGNDGTHVEDMKDPDEVQPPRGDFLFVVLCVDVSGNHISFSLLDDIPLDLRHSPGARYKASSMRYTKCGRLV